MPKAKKRVPVTERLVDGELIQWHLNTSRYDKSPCCYAPMGFLGMRKRVCLATGCDRVWSIRVTTKAWHRIVTGQVAGRGHQAVEDTQASYERRLKEGA